MHATYSISLWNGGNRAATAVSLSHEENLHQIFRSEKKWKNNPAVGCSKSNKLWSLTYLGNQMKSESEYRFWNMPWDFRTFPKLSLLNYPNYVSPYTPYWDAKVRVRFIPFVCSKCDLFDAKREIKPTNVIAMNFMYSSITVRYMYVYAYISMR